MRAANVDRFRDLAEPELGRLYRIARRIVPDEAEDAVQDCLLKAFRGLGQLDRDEAAPAWLRSILVNCCRDRIRRRARRPTEIWIEDLDDFSLYRKLASEDPFPYSDSLHLDFLHRFERGDVREVLASLPDHYRQPMLLVYVDGLHAKEVARMMETPLGTMLARLHRGRKLFERRLWEYAEANDMLKEPVS
ncbi:MAG TPA: sigma-70 family RNA polymerase sigma factor [Gaiellaceae bacterium]